MDALGLLLSDIGQCYLSFLIEKKTVLVKAIIVSTLPFWLFLQSCHVFPIDLKSAVLITWQIQILDYKLFMFAKMSGHIFSF